MIEENIIKISNYVLHTHSDMNKISNYNVLILYNLQYNLNLKMDFDNLIYIHKTISIFTHMCMLTGEDPLHFLNK